MAPDSRMLDAAQSILNNLAIDLAARGIDVPDRRFITTGIIPHDFAGARCVEAFVITWDGLFQGIVSQAAGGDLANAPILCAMPLTAQYTVALLRCVPVLTQGGSPPTVAQMQASGEALMLDAMTLPVSIVELQLEGDLFELVGVRQAEPIGPEGGVGGVAVSFVVTLF